MHGDLHRWSALAELTRAIDVEATTSLEPRWDSESNRRQGNGERNPSLSAMEVLKEPSQIDVAAHLTRERWWAHQDLNLEPTDYESAALTVEL